MGPPDRGGPSPGPTGDEAQNRIAYAAQALNGGSRLRQVAVGLELDDRFPIGRDPREMSRQDLLALGHQPMSPMKALRLRCLDCCCDQPSEVRKCTAVKCPSWPFRMGDNPWRAEPSEAQREAGRRVGARRASLVGNPNPGLASGDAEALAATGHAEAADAA